VGKGLKEKEKKRRRKRRPELSLLKSDSYFLERDKGRK